LAKKITNQKESPGAKKKKNRIMAFFVMAAVIAGIGVGSMLLGGGGKIEIPPAKTPDGRVVVVEFFDFG
jgi:hypothetical protein